MAARGPKDVVEACREVAEHMAVSKETTGEVNLTDALEHFKAAVESTPVVQLAEATAIMQMMNGTDLSLGDRKIISDILKSKMSMGGPRHGPVSSNRPLAQAGGRQLGQQCPSFHRYMTKAMWELWLSPQCTFQQALQSLSKRCDELGLVSPSEPCKRDIWCVWVACRTPPGMQPIEDPTECLRKKDAIGNELALLRARYRLKHHGRVLRHPDNPAELSTQDKEVWDIAFPIDAKPVPCPIDEAMIYLLQQKLPCRITHITVANTVRAPKARHALGSSLARGIRDGGMHQPGDPYCPGLRLTPGAHGHG
eukprot:7994804-Pyramimonas_sp.AAC.2